jgi:hypothetical protein
MMKFRLWKRTAGRGTAHLQADSATVRYELDMLLDAAQRYQEADAQRDAVGKNMAVESFAVHCRGLILFLFGHVEGLEAAGQNPERFSGDRDTDIFAWDYHLGWRYDCPEPSEVLYHAKKRADKHVAHLTTDRRGVNQVGTGVESVWQLQATLEELATAFARFLHSAPAGNFDPAELRKMKTRLAPWIAGLPRPAAPIIAKSGSLDCSSVVKLEGKTDARTGSPAPSYRPYAKME